MVPVYWKCGLDVNCSLKNCVWGPPVRNPVWENLEPLGDGSSLEEVGHWGRDLRHHLVLVPVFSMLPGCWCNMGRWPPTFVSMSSLASQDVDLQSLSQINSCSLWLLVRCFFTTRRKVTGKQSTFLSERHKQQAYVHRWPELPKERSAGCEARGTSGSRLDQWAQWHLASYSPHWVSEFPV